MLEGVHSQLVWRQGDDPERVLYAADQVRSGTQSRGSESRQWGAHEDIRGRETHSNLEYAVGLNKSSVCDPRTSGGSLFASDLLVRRACCAAVLIAGLLVILRLASASN